MIASDPASSAVVNIRSSISTMGSIYTMGSSSNISESGTYVAESSRCHESSSSSASTHFEGPSRKGSTRNSRKIQQQNLVISFLQSELTIDICLMVDCTDSMTPLIEKVKQVGIDCLKSIKESLHFNTFRVAFIGYRDFDCIPEEQSVVIDFTDDIESFVAKVSAVKCFGGRDQAEDVFGGFSRVNSALSWKSRTQVVIHIGDAPSHGSDFYEKRWQVGDDSTAKRTVVRGHLKSPSRLVYGSGIRKGDGFIILPSKTGEQAKLIRAKRDNPYWGYFNYFWSDYECVGSIQIQSTGKYAKEYYACKSSGSTCDHHEGSKSLEDARRLFRYFAKKNRYYIMGSMNHYTDYMYRSFHSVMPRGDLSMMIPFKDLSKLPALLQTSISKATQSARHGTLTRPISYLSTKSLSESVCRNLFDAECAILEEEKENPEVLPSRPALPPPFNDPQLADMTLTPLVSRSLTNLIRDVLSKKRPRSDLMDAVLLADEADMQGGAGISFEEEGPVRVRMAQSMFAQGANHAAYHGYEWSSPGTVVVFKVLKGSKPSDIRKKLAQRYAITQGISGYLVEVFNKKVSSNFQLQTRPVQIFVDKDRDVFYISEQYLAGHFVKYNNNAGFICDANTTTPSFKAAQAFSHFSHHYSKEKVMLTDLQGVGSTLVDVGLHTWFGCEYDGTDLTTPGMQRFFQTHRCNEVCKQLEIPDSSAEW